MRALWQMPELQEIWNHIETGETPVTVTGLSPVHRRCTSRRRLSLIHI